MTDGNKETPKPRRPLPIPNARPSTPTDSRRSTNTPTPVPTSTFYSSTPASASSSSYQQQQQQLNPPALPSRSKTVGSSHTRYVAPSTGLDPILRPTSAGASRAVPLFNLPTVSHDSPYREPELIVDETVPELVPADDAYWQQNGGWGYARGGTGSGGGGGGSGGGVGGWGSGGWGTGTAATANNWAEFDSAWAGGGFTTTDHSVPTVQIYGRDEEEEKKWWDAEVRIQGHRPGTGILPPLLEEKLHNPEHSLFSVIGTPPDIRPRQSTSGPSTSMENIPSSSLATSLSVVQPTADEFRHAVPHPNAYYCRKHNGWVLLIWKSSKLPPPLAKSFVAYQEEKGITLPDQGTRELHSCVGEGENPPAKTNKTHHFHFYPRAVDASKLNPPFRRSAWEKEDRTKQRRRKVTIQDGMDLDEQMKLHGGIGIDEGKMVVLTDEPQGMDVEEEEEGDLLDLYICCQCSFYCVVSSEVIPGVLPTKFIEDLTKDKLEHPTLGKNGEQTVLLGWETILTIIENRLWKGESRSLPVGRSAFQKKLGWNNTVRHIFEHLGFTEKMITTGDKQEPVLAHPKSDIGTVEGRTNRAKLLRAWVELSAWLTDYRKRFAPALKGIEPHELRVKVNSVREMYQTAIGAHPEQVPRNSLPESIVHYSELHNDWAGLGLTPTSASSEIIQFAYLAQCRCDPAGTIDYFTHLCNIVIAFETLGESPPLELQNLMVEERSRLRFTRQDLESAIRLFGFGKDGELHLDWDDDIEESFIENAWKNALKKAWRDHTNGSQLRRDANEAFRMIAEFKGSKKLMEMCEDERTKGMTPDAAYSTLEVPETVEEEMLIMVFMARLDEQPSQVDRMRQALAVIAEVRDSSRLRSFLETGKDPGEIVVSAPFDMPRGLNQLGNTCYLNSLLQYFYTIKDLREAVSAGGRDVKAIEDGKLTEDDLKRHRVGGRMVTRREILRSKKFVAQLAELFWQMEYCDTDAVTPTIELAKLALVTSKDEEEDSVDTAATDSSNDTDATLVDDTPTIYPVVEVSPPPADRSSPGSVLGKRARAHERRASVMDVDDIQSPTDKDREDYVVVSKPSSPEAMTPPDAGSSSSSRKDKDGDVEMDDTQSAESKQVQQPPPLPPRRTTKAPDSGMMFGRQHDVAECMDNCIFQIETALLKFDEMTQGDDDKTSVVKRLFYGKLRQRLTGPDDGKSKSSVHEKEDLFSHLPVNVSDEGHDLYDGLGGYFEDTVEFQGKPARMEVTLVDLPPMLQIQLQRVQFNRETFQAYKSQAYIKFGETVYMDRFLDSADPQKKARSKAIQAELNECRERIQRLTQGKHAPYTPSLEAAHEFLSQQESVELPEVDVDLLAQLGSEPARLKTLIEEQRTRAAHLKEELEDVWRNDNAAAYELTSVFIHRGSSPSFGHYFFYSRNLPEKPDSWFKYNDSSVSIVSKDEVLADTTGDTANPYLLVFMRKGLEVVDTVKRFDPLSVEEPETS
ncbi:hypothetical protein JAAARDRAFT_199352 [Jaapia argillacea MUCL 33604]|uniref:ubiquitinyl hydrolase 1 n=1 Tax=Jaapia argillacea MUCL 33604 TaxID=933084 RepID=A0A067P8A0_9AGAM|nr:hypothetical protein JAAARDRAFT_199352 [Jaapia argillacea MUCL 33604]